MIWRPCTVALHASLLLLSNGCALQQAYDPALPAVRTSTDQRPLGLESSPPRPVPPEMPTDEAWHAVPAAPQPPPSRPQPVVRPRRERATRPGVLRHYVYTPGTLYAIPTSPASPTYLVLPPGERLAAPPAVNPEAWAVGMVQMGTDAARRETVVLRPLHPGPRPITALLFQSGLMIFCQLVARAQPGLVAVTWDLPPATPRAADPAETPAPPVALRPPLVDRGRLHTHYRVEPQQRLTPPWLPVAVFDDGSRTYIQFREALTYTRAPGVVGVTPAGTTALVQSQLYTVPGQPERGAWLIVQGLWPALELHDSDRLKVRLVRQAPPPPTG